MTFETRSVLAGAYGSMSRSPGATERSMLTHVVELDADRNELRVLCRRVKLESMLIRLTPKPPGVRLRAYMAKGPRAVAPAGAHGRKG